eukprot:272643-Chlamydomonas_euryale.AAC.3
MPGAAAAACVASASPAWGAALRVLPKKSAMVLGALNALASSLASTGAAGSAAAHAAAVATTPGSAQRCCWLCAARSSDTTSPS